MYRPEELQLDEEAVARALKAPRTPQFGSGTRPKYRLEDRLPGVGTLGSIVPLSERHLEAMRPTSPPPERNVGRPIVLGVVLVALAAVTGAIVYRDMHRTPAPAAPTISE